MAKTNHLAMILTIGITVFLIGYALESFRVGTSLLRDYFQISTELLPLVLTFSIFAITWLVFKRKANNKSPFLPDVFAKEAGTEESTGYVDNQSLFLGLAFFIIGLIDLYHILSYPFMPDFITPNSLEKSQVFWGVARIVTAVLFLASAYVHNDTFQVLQKKPVLIASVAVISFSSIALFAGINPELFPMLTSPDGGPSREKMLLLITTSMALLYTGYLYTIRIHETGNKILICLLYGFVLTAFSDLIYLFLEYPGHLMKAAGLYFFYMGMFKTSIDMPYETMVEAGEKRIHEAQERYRNLFDSANDAIILTDPDNTVTSWNKSAERIFGWTETEILGKKFLPMSFDQKLQPDSEQIIRNAISGGTVTGIETILKRKDGKEIDVGMTLSPLRDTNQEVIGLSGIFRDITEKKQAQEQIENSLKEKEVLLREIHHRVKNNMQIISSLLKLQSGYIKDNKYIDMYKDSQNRITTMSLIHEKLYQSKDLSRIDLGGYIKELVEGLFISYNINPGKITMNINVDSVSMGINSAIPCGLIINELISNSLKYAFPDGRPGEIRISLRSTGNSNFELIVGDNGVGLPIDMDLKNTESWGMRMVAILIENQLHGKFTINRDRRTEYHIIFKEVK
ncbi:MAG: PAS domain S-box protein [Euryarchaeota archaeon]|nr:PAS domain S-box protein [Euryarchaeota archaeon]